MLNTLHNFKLGNGKDTTKEAYYMKKLLAGFLTLTLALAACSNGSDDNGGSKDDSSKDKQSSDDKSKDSKDSKSDDKKDNDSSDKDSDSNSDNKSDSDAEKNSSDSDSSSNSDDSSNSGNSDNANDSSTNGSNGSDSNSDNSNNDNNSSNADSNDSTASNANSNADQASNSAGNSNAGNTGNSGASQYVAPYQGQNAVPVAQNITSGSTDAQTALQSLPNFQNALDNATAEVNALNGQSNPYNDYAIEGSEGNYSYIFSFQNQAQPGSYSIVTVDQQGTVRVVDPAYQQ